MSNTDHRGASASVESDDLSEMVANLIHLSVDAVSEVSGYNLSTCNQKIEELTNYISHPTGPQQTIPQVLGQLTLLYKQRSELQSEEHEEELRAMQAVCRAEQVSNSHLQATNSQLRQEMEQLKKSMNRH